MDGGRQLARRLGAGTPARLLAAALLAAAVLAPEGCSLFGAGAATPPATAPADEGAEPTFDPDDPLSGGVLNAIAHMAPQGSPSRYLARLAAEFGWEEQVARNQPLRQAVVDEDFAQKVEPHLLGLYYRNGFSVLPVVGEGHQFARDSLVRGAVASSRLLVTTREPIRIIFLDGADNVQIVYPQDGTEPRVFAIDENAVVAVRQSLLEQYLR